MKKLYITHRPEELAMALVQVNCVGIAVWLFFFFDHPMLRFIFAELGILAAVMAWIFLFRMNGSDERAKAAAKTQEATDAS